MYTKHDWVICVQRRFAHDYISREISIRHKYKYIQWIALVPNPCYWYPCLLYRSDSNQNTDCIVIFVSLISGFMWKISLNLKGPMGRDTDSTSFINFSVNVVKKLSRLWVANVGDCRDSKVYWPTYPSGHNTYTHLTTHAHPVQSKGPFTLAIY